MSLEFLPRRLATTIHNYIRGAVDVMSRKRKLLALMRSKGKMEMNCSGDMCDWGVEYQEGSLSAYTGNFTFTPVDRFKRAQLDWGGYAVPDVIQERERIVNKGKEALIKVYGEMGKRLEADMRKQFPEQLLISDGNAAGSELAISGLETFFSISGAEAADVPVGVNNDAYAGISTAGGAYGGDWDEDSDGDSIWPKGNGPTVFDFWRPLVVLYDSASPKLSAATPSWRNNCEEALRFGIDFSMRNDNVDGQLDIVLLWIDGYRQFKEVQASKERINVSTESPLYKLGFRDMLNFEGVDITKEYDVPDEVGYGIPTGVMTLQSLLPELFRVRDEFDLASDSHRFVCDFHGQLKCESIRHFVKWRKIPV